MDKRITVQDNSRRIRFLVYNEQNYMVIPCARTFKRVIPKYLQPLIIPLNFQLLEGRPVPAFEYINGLDKAQRVAKVVRDYITQDGATGTDLCGSCIEAAELTVACLKEYRVNNARTVEGWCRFDDDCYGSDRPYDPHTWVEIPGKDLDHPEHEFYYLDVTAEQFNPGMAKENEYPPIILQPGLPHGMRHEEPQDY